MSLPIVNDPLPQMRGVIGVVPREPVGVVARAGVRTAKGAVDAASRKVFHLMNPETASVSFGSWSAPTSTPHPLFEAWNKLADAGDPRCGTLYGNLVHGRLSQAAWWNRSAYRLPGLSPASRRPACSGDGIRAQRFAGMIEGREHFNEIICPNDACEFAIGDKPACKRVTHLLFRLRWPKGGWPEMLCAWSSRGLRTLASELGMFEHVLGTERVCPDARPREEWIAGLAAEMGIQEPSLFGMPVMVTIGERTNPAAGTRYPVARWSSDGDLVQWLLGQARAKRELIALSGSKASPLALSEPLSMDDPESEIVRLDGLLATASPAEYAATVAVGEPAIEDAEEIEPEPEPMPEFLGAAQVYELERLCGELGVPVKDLCASIGASGGLSALKVSAQDTPAALAKRIEATIRAKAGQRTAQPSPSSRKK